MPEQLISPHGGSLVNLVVTPERAAELKDQSRNWPSWDLSPRQLCDLELLANGGFSPLEGFLAEDDYEAVCDRMRLSDGTIWPVPVNLGHHRGNGGAARRRSEPGAPGPRGRHAGGRSMFPSSTAPTSSTKQSAFSGRTDKAHPGVAYLLDKVNPVYVAGQLERRRAPGPLRLQAPPAGAGAATGRFYELGWERVVAFQTRNPMHRAHVELTLRAARQIEANLLIHPSVGMTKPGDVDHHTRVRCYQAVLKGYPHATATLSLLPLAMRMGGPREAVWHAIIRKNYGASHLIVGRDHAGPGNDSHGPALLRALRRADAAQRARERARASGWCPFQQMVYVEDRDEYMPVDEVPSGDARARHLGDRAAPAPGGRA